jgi:uncharacterized protein YfdQ (DUF2303 family)
MAENNGTLDGGAVKAVAELARKAALTINTSEAIHFAVLPHDTRVESLASLQYPFGIPPTRIRASVQMRDAASFCAYVSKYRDERTRLFAEPRTFTFLAVLDYHAATEATRTPEFCDHKATFALQKDERWNIWSGKDGQSFTQADFAEFLEDNRADILTPEPAQMLEIARDLSAKVDVNFGSSVRLSNGQTQLRYEETVKASVPAAGNIEVPEEFTILIPVFYGEMAQSIRVRLRFRLAQGKLSFHFKMYRPAEILTKAFQRAVGSINEKLDTEVLLGGPA